MKKICFVVPQMKDGWLKVEFSSREALGVQYLCAMLEKKAIPYEFINAHAYRIDDEEVCRRIINDQIDLVAISCISQRGYPNVKQFVHTLRHKFSYQGIIWMGGFFATLAYQEILKDMEDELDFIVRGEGEYVTMDIIEKLSQGERISQLDGIVYLEGGRVCGSLETNYIEKLDDLEFPIRDVELLKNVEGEIPNFKMMAGRGCYNKCSFCSIVIDGRPRRKRYRSPENVVHELAMLIDKYQVRHFRFCDEIFYTNNKFGRDWITVFCDLVKENDLNFTFHIEMRAVDVTKTELLKLKEVGLKTVSIGFESGVQRILDEMRKNCTVGDNIQAAKILKEINIDHNLSFITIIPTMSFTELKENYQFLKQIGGYTAHNLYNKLNLYVGCEYEVILEKAGLLDKKDKFYERSNFRYLDRRVQFLADRIEDMKREVLKCRKFVLYVTTHNNLNRGIVDYFDELFKKFIIHFIEFSMAELEQENLKKGLYSEYIETRILEILQQLEAYCVDRSLKFTMDLEQIASDHIFV